MEKEEAKKPIELATHLQIMKWLGSNNGLVLYAGMCATIIGPLPEELLDKPARRGLKVRKWGEADWQDPTPEYLGLDQGEST